ncbi:MAG: alkaline phosphatase family protein [Acidimicrobiales bacterium]
MVARPVPAATTPEPVLPDFGGRCLTEVVRTLLAQVGGQASGSPPSWLPEPARGARQIALLVLDGLGARQLEERAARLAPVLGSGEGTTVTSVAPSTTAAALTSLSTGLPPAVHGVAGYRVAVGDDILNVLSWRLGDRDGRRLVPPRQLQRHPAFPTSPGPVPVVSRKEYAATGFTAAHLGDAPLYGWHTPSGLVVEVSRLLARGAPFVYAYYDGIDRTAHACGLDDRYDAELRAVDRMVGDLLGALPAGAALVVTADHGQVEVGSAIEVLGGDVMEAVTLLSGEGRFRWLHARAGAKDALYDLVAERYREVAWVRDVDQVVDDGWLGGAPGPDVRARLGDVALVPFVATAFLDPADAGEQRLVCRHGSLTPDEMFVPLVAWTHKP